MYSDMLISFIFSILEKIIANYIWKMIEEECETEKWLGSLLWILLEDLVV